MRCNTKQHTSWTRLLALLTITTLFSVPAVAQDRQFWGDGVTFGDNKSMHYVTHLSPGRTIVGATNIYRYNNGGDLWFSPDGGETWIQSEERVAVINNIEFAPPEEDTRQGAADPAQPLMHTTGYAAGGREQIGIAMFIGKTTDGGATWTDLSDNFRRSLDTGSVAMYGLAVISADDLYVSCRHHVYRGRGGGATWQQMGDIRSLKPVDRVPLHHDLQFRSLPDDPSPLYGFVSSSDSLFVTRNGGNSWERIDPPWNVEDRNVNLMQLHFFDAAHGLALTGGEVSPGFRGAELLRTSDGGHNWWSVGRWSYSEPATPLAFHAVVPDIIWLGGAREHIWVSRNGGAEWELEHSSPTSRAVLGFSRTGPEGGPVAWTGLLQRGRSRVSGYLTRSPYGLPAVVEQPAVVVEQPAEPAAPAPEPEETPLPVVSDVVTAAGYGPDGLPIDPRSNFSPAHNPIHLWLRLNNPPAGETISAVWYYLGLAEPLQIGVTDDRMTAEAGHFEASFELAEGNQWPEGEYRIEIFIGDEQVSTAIFRVVAD